MKNPPAINQIITVIVTQFDLFVRNLQSPIPLPFEQAAAEMNDFLVEDTSGKMEGAYDAYMQQLKQIGGNDYVMVFEPYKLDFSLYFQFIIQNQPISQQVSAAQLAKTLYNWLMQGYFISLREDDKIVPFL